MKLLLFVLVVIVSFPSVAQVKTYGRERSYTAPLQCQQQALPHMRQFCGDLEWMLVQMDAKRRGGVTPSERVIVLPGMYSDDAKSLGYACVGGYAVQRIRNGWSQVLDNENRPQRCRQP